MIQLIIDTSENNVVLPESKKGGYIVKEETLSEDIQMISGRTVREYRGKVWSLSYQYGYFNDADMKSVISACEKGMQKSIICAFRTHENSDLISSSFIVTSFNRPKFMWSRTVTEDGEVKTVPMWADFSVNLLEVRPHA